MVVAGHLNKAMCFLKLEENLEAIHSCDEVLKLEKANEKAVFRKASVSSAFGNLFALAPSQGRGVVKGMGNAPGSTFHIIMPILYNYRMVWRWYMLFRSGSILSLPKSWRRHCLRAFLSISSKFVFICTVVM